MIGEMFPFFIHVQLAPFRPWRRTDRERIRGATLINVPSSTQTTQACQGKGEIKILATLPGKQVTSQQIISQRRTNIFCRVDKLRTTESNFFCAPYTKHHYLNDGEQFGEHKVPTHEYVNVRDADFCFGSVDKRQNLLRTITLHEEESVPKREEATTYSSMA